MLIKIKVFPNAKKEEIIRKGEDSFEIKVREKPVGNQANLAVLKVLSRYLQAPVGSIRIVKGAKSRNKILEIKL